MTETRERTVTIINKQAEGQQVEILCQATLPAAEADDWVAALLESDDMRQACIAIWS